MEEKINEFLLGFGMHERAAESIAFFIYDSIKIIILLFFMIMIIGYLRSYVSQERLKKSLTGKGGISHFFASAFGALTPFCSCSSIPFFMSFLKAGVPLGVSLSFLITSPLVNEYVVVIMLATFGLKITATYVAFGMLIGIISGMIIGAIGMDKYIEKDFRTASKVKEKIFKNQKERIIFGLQEAKDIIVKMWKWVLLGVGIGAALHGFVPDTFVQTVITKGGILGVPLAVLVGIPLYANCAAIVPVALVLFQKGFPLGTAIAFMMATAALSLPEAILLRRVMKLKLIGVFFTVAAIGMIIIGYSLNALY